MSEDSPSRPLRSVLATDCGSTTTKAILIELVDGEYRQTWRGEAPTTVEAPFEDVTRGVLNAAQEVAELSGRKLVADDGSGIITPAASPPATRPIRALPQTLTVSVAIGPAKPKMPAPITSITP